MGYVVSGIQQVGIGVANAEEAWAWYRKHFGFDVPIFKDSAQASLMTRYTSGIAETRYAILAMNLQGGGGFEIWQYTSKLPQASAAQHLLGDTGVFAVKLKSIDVLKSHKSLTDKGANVLSNVTTAPDGRKHFFVADPYANIFEITESTSWFKPGKFSNGGVNGVVIGVSNMEAALPIYKNILGHSTIGYDTTDSFSDLSNLAGGSSKIRRVLLKTQGVCKGAFGNLLGATEIELIETKDRTPNKMFAHRNWGDLGFIHVCFDIRGMKSLAEKCAATMHPFTVDSSNSFDMGKAAGHFSYIEDPDGTLIEFVETHKIPIFEKYGLYLNIKNRKLDKTLPNWVLSMLSLSRVRD
jgi:catechol 2,3-dioxygenase-like lactoylglutathione lyase family enzyme